MDIYKVDRIIKEDNNLQEISNNKDNWSVRKDISILDLVLVDIFVDKDVTVGNDLVLHVIQVNGQINYIVDEKIVNRNPQVVSYTD